MIDSPEDVTVYLCGFYKEMGQTKKLLTSDAFNISSRRIFSEPLLI